MAQLRGEVLQLQDAQEPRDPEDEGVELQATEIHQRPQT